jgi:hypothetical protein
MESFLTRTKEIERRMVRLGPSDFQHTRSLGSPFETFTQVEPHARALNRTAPNV